MKMNNIIIRDAQIEDLERLTELKKPTALHRDRIKNADNEHFRYLVLEIEGKIQGFTCLVFKEPPSWRGRQEHTVEHPRIVDLFINEQLCDQRLGSKFMWEIELILKKSGYEKLFLSVDPIDNSKAHKFYKKLGYQDIQSKPFRCHWEFTDSDGNKHEGNEWNIDMFKNLKQNQ